MKKKGKLFAIVGGFIIIVSICFLYKSYKDLSALEDAMDPVESLTAIYFENIDDTIYIKTKVWGLLGGHSLIYITNRITNEVPTDNDIVFKQWYNLYYKKQEPDSLLIYSFAGYRLSEVGEVKKLGSINIKEVQLSTLLNRDSVITQMELMEIDVYKGK